MTLAKRIRGVCRARYNRDMGVMPPQVCPYCYGCPIATLVCGVSGRNAQTITREPLPIPEKDQEEVNQWLDKLEKEVTAKAF